MTNPSDDPFRQLLKRAGVIHAFEPDKLPDSQVEAEIGTALALKHLTTSEFSEACEARLKWLKVVNSEKRVRLLKSSPELREAVRRDLETVDGMAAADDNRDVQSELDEMERKLAKKFGLPLTGRDSEDLNAVHARLTKNLHSGDTDMSAGQELMDMARREAGEGDGVRVKSIAERYSTDRKIGKHRKAHMDERYDRPMLYQGKEVTEPSELECALAGAWLKRLAIKNGHNHVMREHDQNLLAHLYEKSDFIVDDHEKSTIVKGARAKALLDDSTSGGQNAVPVWFDRIAVTEPLLFGELFPLVTLREVDKGSSFSATSVENVTVTEGVGAAEGTALTLFDTANMIAGITGDFHTVSIALTLGLDFLEDAAIDVGMTVKEVIGARFAERYDLYVAKGATGSGQPLGVMNTSGTNNFTPTTPTTGPIVLADALEGYFAVPPSFRKRAGSRFSYCANDTMYSRLRAIATGVTGDTRLAFGMDIGSYDLWEGKGRTNFAIVQDMANDEMFTCDLSQYRFYRRRGMSLKVETGGDTLTRSNLALFYARCRVGGKLVNPTAAAVATGFMP